MQSAVSKRQTTVDFATGFFFVYLSPVFNTEIVSDVGQNPLSRPIRRMKRRKRRKDRQKNGEWEEGGGGRNTKNNGRETGMNIERRLI